MKNGCLVISMVMLFISCKNEVNRVSENVLKKGIWKAELTVQDNKLLPFNFKLNEDESITIFNAEEKIIVNEVEIIGDSIIIQMPVYEGVLKGKIVSNEIIRGEFVKPSLQRTVPFILKHGDFQRFEVINESNADVEGSWRAFEQRTW